MKWKLKYFTVVQTFYNNHNQYKTNATNDELNTKTTTLTHSPLRGLWNDTWWQWSRPVRLADRWPLRGRTSGSIDQVLQVRLLLLQVRMNWADGLHGDRVRHTLALSRVRGAHIRSQVDQLDVRNGQRQVAIVLVLVRPQRDHRASLPPGH